MHSARGIYRLGLSLAGLAAAALALALAVAAVSIDLNAPVPSLGQLADACVRFLAGDTSAGSMVVLGLGSLSLASVALGARSAWRQVRAQRRFVSAIHVCEHLRRGQIRASVIDDARPHAFCTGYLRPRIFLSSGARDALTDDELGAVLAHEAHHATRRDPLRVLSVRVLSDALFFLPIMRHARDRFAALAEVAADAAAVRQCGGDRAPLASAMLRFGESAGPEVVGIAPERVDHLLGEAPHWHLPASLLVGGLITLGGIVALAAGTAESVPAGTVPIPVLAMQLCAVVMTILPAALGAGLMLAARRALSRDR